ncbi:MAG: type II toxin-antitoxin system RelE/ParE family toxin [Nitrospiraceae bacterium]|nr:type II toxin-antitoxin system RelE/ParE family toxin [Nitrospiraceae bacterium]
MTAIVFLPPAQEEMTAASRYYQAQSTGLGTEFLAEVERTIAAIVSHPKAAPKVKPDIRRRLLKRFPFGILYVATVDEIVVLAVMHLRRRPGYWQGRLGLSKQSQ